MSADNNLKEFVTIIANAIRSKKGTTKLINPQDFSSEIESIQGAGYNIEQVDLDDGTCELRITDPDYISLYTLTLGASGDGSSRITISNDISAKYTAGQEVLITATKGAIFDSAYSFKGWYDGDTLISSSLSFTYTMPNRDVTLTAKTTEQTIIS